MDNKIKNYQAILEDFLAKEAQDRVIPGLEFQVIADKQNNHLQLVEMGWYEKRYIHSVIFHFQIKPTGRIWILANNTDILVAEALMKLNVLASDIVIGFHPVNVRPFTGFTVA